MKMNSDGKRIVFGGHDMENKSYLSYYMEFDSKYTGNLNKYGGLPTHLPTQWPVTDQDGDEMTFLCQLYCDDKMLSIPDTLCIQVYQLVINDLEASDPIIVQVPIGAKENVDKRGIPCKRLPEGDIKFKEVREEINEESIKRLVDQNDNHLVSSKLGGWCPSEDVEQDAFLGAIHDGDYFSPFNWGCGCSLIMYLNEDNQVVWDFW